jgi:hypothetical protein
VAVSGANITRLPVELMWINIAIRTLRVRVTTQQMMTRMAETMSTKARKNAGHALPWGAAAPR